MRTRPGLCPITVTVPIPPVDNGRGRGERVTNTRACGEPVAADDLCAKHLADKERLS